MQIKKDMSVIAFKITENKIQVAADGRALIDDRIANENFKKIRLI